MGLLDGGVEVLQIRNLNLKDGGYESGDTITGEVILVCNRDIKCREFLITLYGRAQTEWQRTQYTYDGSDNTLNYHACVKIIEDCTVFNGQGIIAPGQYIYKFLLKLPNDCPPTFMGAHGHIMYTLTAKIDRPMAVDNEVVMQIPVRGIVDLRTMGGHLLKPVESHGVSEIGVCCCRDGRLKMRASSPKSGYAVGEHINLTIEVENYTSNPVTGIFANILENATFTGYNGFTWGGGGQAEKCNATKPILSAIKPVNIPPQKTAEISFPFVLPKTIAPQVLCSIIQTEHAIEVCAQLYSGMKGSACVLPIKIGTIPCCSDEVNL